mmetsp:Transcript_395/g.556  ORF Transcript_395/g.556 Transcript_395/m.556 type:complete len:126 (-) Transcript_395:64-441(-)
MSERFAEPKVGEEELTWSNEAAAAEGSCLDVECPWSSAGWWTVSSRGFPGPLPLGPLMPDPASNFSQRSRLAPADASAVGAACSVPISQSEDVELGVSATWMPDIRRTPDPGTVSNGRVGRRLGG